MKEICCDDRCCFEVESVFDRAYGTNMMVAYIFDKNEMFKNKRLESKIKPRLWTEFVRVIAGFEGRKRRFGDFRCLLWKAN